MFAASDYPVNASTAYLANGINVRFVDLCVYPQVNVCSGKGETAFASSYECVEPLGEIPGTLWDILSLLWRA